LGYQRTIKERTWGAEVFPGASLPFAMVQLTPVTRFRSGAGYEYEDQQIYGFAHTCKGHWNLLHLPLLPVTGKVNADEYASPFQHSKEKAQPGYYRVQLERYGVNAELTSTLRCAFHRYTFAPEVDKELLVDITRSNNNISEWELRQVGDSTFEGFQNGEGKLYFYAHCNYPIHHIEQVKGNQHEVSIIHFRNSRNKRPLEIKLGCSFVSMEGARMNLEREIGHKSFQQIRHNADQTWEHQLEKIKVTGGTPRQRGIFYSCLYRSQLWPALRSDVNGNYTDARGNILNGGFDYYTDPSFWDDYRNKLILVGLLSPKVATNIIKSITDRGEKQGGYMPTFFHGDHASTFVAGSYLRGIQDFDLNRAYRLLLKNATVPGHGGRPYLDEYLKQGWIAEKDTVNVPTWDEYKAAVTKTVEYAYDDYATALVAKTLGDTTNCRLLMKRSMNYKNLFDTSTGFWRGRIANGSWIRDFNPYYPYYAYMYREANAWQSLFYAPHDPQGAIALYPSKHAAELKLDSLFSEPWRGYEAYNLTGFIGNYCQGNQPDHSVPYMYYFVGRQEKAQIILDSIMNHFYDMGTEHLAYAGMDDAGEMSAWYVFNAMGLYTFSPADPEYIVTVPLFPRIRFAFNNGHTLTILRHGTGYKIKDFRYAGQKQKNWFITDKLLKQGHTLEINVE
jgi:predicted alpha-1,2-mannosidase